MKTPFLSLMLVTLLLMNCNRKIKINTPLPEADRKIPMTSINAMKDGVEFINYLGTKLPGC